MKGKGKMVKEKNKCHNLNNSREEGARKIGN